MGHGVLSARYCVQFADEPQNKRGRPLTLGRVICISGYTKELGVTFLKSTLAASSQYHLWKENAKPLNIVVLFCSYEPGQDMFQHCAD